MAFAMGAFVFGNRESRYQQTSGEYAPVRQHLVLPLGEGGPLAVDEGRQDVPISADSRRIGSLYRWALSERPYRRVYNYAKFLQGRSSIARQQGVR